ncbi:cytosine permease [Egibacter rhizosphaerae]|uniref:Cytosine permease n=1 Tax=Egibacter rhizosphaerae TaxID=1670831 RepID=A0A411YJ73_9ACTN|nr:cytosine permease [Egibacter rhizosphaerae]QBI21263.1 cytosine permease [Egibacter rhizosphaerae]
MADEAHQDIRSKGVVDPDYPLTEVPGSARRGFLSLLVVLLGFTFFTPTMLAGAQVGAAFTLGDFLGVVLLGSVILGGYVAVLAWIGAKSGLTAVLLCRHALGRVGAKWGDLMLGGTQVGWFAITVAFFGLITAEAFGIPELDWLMMIIGAALMGLSAYFGYKGIQLISAISVPLMFILAFWVLAEALGEAGGWEGLAAVEPVETMTLGTALTIVVGTFASGGTNTPNWSRFARAPWHGFTAAVAAFFAANLLMLFFGAVGAIAFGEPDFVDVLLQLGLVGAAVALLAMNLWTTNDNAAYAFGVAGAEAFGVRSKRPFVIIGVAIALVLALTGIWDRLEDFLILLGVFIPPLGGVIIGDFLFNARGRLPDIADTAFRMIRWDGLIAYLAGTGAAWLGNTLDVGIPPLFGIVVAAVGVPVASAAFRALGAPQTHQVTGSSEEGES